MNAATWLQRARRTPPVAALLALLAAPLAWWRELAAMQRGRHIWSEVEALLDHEHRLRQDLQGLELVKCLHDEQPVRERAKARQAVLEQELAGLRRRRRALQQEAARLPG
jgi:hypothetical protein